MYSSSCSTLIFVCQQGKCRTICKPITYCKGNRGGVKIALGNEGYKFGHNKNRNWPIYFLFLTSITQKVNYRMQNDAAFEGENFLYFYEVDL